MIQPEYEALIPRIPMARMGAPEDVAEAITWSCARPGRVNVQEMVLYPTCQAGVRDVVRDA